MITAGTLDMPLRTPEQALAESLANLHRRLPIGSPAVHMDGTRGRVQDIVVRDGQARLIVMLDGGQVSDEIPGFWSRSSL